MKQQTALVWIAVLSALVALVLGIWSLFVGMSGGYYSPNESDVALKAGLAAWSNYLLVVTVVAGVGAAVIAGVRSGTPKARPADEGEPSHLDADGL